MVVAAAGWRRKVETLLECGAAVRVVAPTLEPACALPQQGRITVRQGPYAPADLMVPLVIAATNAPEVNAGGRRRRARGGW